jgi:ABC-2 type transport system ATP-binding protein
MIKTENINKYYGYVKALNNITLDFNNNCIYGLLGPNGAGKTTFLKILSGIMLPDTGNVSINNVKLNVMDDTLKYNIAYIPDQPNIFPYLTGIEFLEFVKDVYKMDDNEFKTNLDYYINYFDMSDYINSLINSYSHGMRQKVMLTSAFIHKPKYIFIDEPIVGLDPLSINLLKKELIKINQQYENIIIVSTHIVDIVESVCSDLVLINKGEVLINSKMDEVKKKYNCSIENLFFNIGNI